MRFLCTLLLLAGSCFAQTVGAPYPAFVVNPPKMDQFGVATTDGTGFLTSAAYAHNSVAAFVFLGLALAPTPFPFPFNPHVGDPVYLEPAALIGPAQPMIVGGAPNIEWFYQQRIPNDPSLAGTVVYAQCVLALSSGTWAVTHAWITTLI